MCWCFIAPGQCSCSQVALAEAERLGFELLPHASYLQDFSPSDLFPTCGPVVLRGTMTSYELLKAILDLILQKGSQSLNISGQSALKFRGTGTILKNNTETICLEWCFLVEAENFLKNILPVTAHILQRKFCIIPL